MISQHDNFKISYYDIITINKLMIFVSELNFIFLKQRLIYESLFNQLKFIKKFCAISQYDNYIFKFIILLL